MLQGRIKVEGEKGVFGGIAGQDINEMVSDLGAHTQVVSTKML